MSRSYRKPWTTDGYKGSKRRQFFKRRSNKTLRKITDIPDGRAFKKFTDTYNICDYKWLEDPKKTDCWWRLIRK